MFRYYPSPCHLEGERLQGKMRGGRGRAGVHQLISYVTNYELICCFFFLVNNLLYSVCSRLSITSSLQFLPQETEIPFIGRERHYQSQ